MKRLLITIIIGSIFSGFFLPGIFPVLQSNIAFADTTIDIPDTSDPFSCGVTSGAKLLNCIAVIFKGGVTITNWIAGMSGEFVDIMLNYSTQSSSYESEFVSEGWKIFRDISNIGFIFALLYIAISTIVGQGAAKSTLVWVILMALVINFSFFATRVVIDASNILARVFYNNINIEDSEPGESKPITAALVSKANPQKVFENVTHAVQEGTSNASPMELTIGNIFIQILAIGLNAVMIFTFMSIAFLFIGRVIGLWFSIIFSPIAFLSIAFPGGKGWKRIGWKSWSDDLIGTAFLAPVFLFFVYLIILFLNTGFLDDALGGGDGIIKALLGVVVPMGFLITLLLTAKSFTVSLAGQIATTVTGALNKAAMVAGGAAMAGTAVVGGAAVAGAGTVGRALGSVGGTGKMAKLAQGTGKALRRANMYGKDVNWDPRSSVVGKGLNKMGNIAGVGNVLPTFGQDFGKKYGSGAGLKDWSDKRGEEWRKKKQRRADDLAEDAVKYGVDPDTGERYQAQTQKHQGEKDEFMARFGHILEKLDKSLDKANNDVGTAKRDLEIAEKLGDPAEIAAKRSQLNIANAAYEEAKEQRENFKTGKDVFVDGQHYDGPKLEDGQTLKTIEKDLADAQTKETTVSVDTRLKYAEQVKAEGNFWETKAVDSILSGGASRDQHDQASRDVLKKAQQEADKAPKPKETV
jgi:hypothetical protein